MPRGASCHGRVDLIVSRYLVSSTARADTLTQSVLAKAFRGELVPTQAELARAEGRDYECAEQLLAHIRSERETAGSIGATRRHDGAATTSRQPTLPW